MLIFSHLTFNNDGMRSSKRQVTFLSLIFLLKCFPKSTTITLLSTKKNVQKMSGVHRSTNAFTHFNHRLAVLSC